MTDYTTHPDYRAMLAGIRADRADDLKRLVLADWLDEHGQTDRAELIRVQCAPLYTVSCQQVTYPLADIPGQESLADIEVRCLDYQDGRSEVVEKWCRQCKLRHRVLQIIESWDDEITRHVPHPFRANGWTGYVVKTYERGFLHTVRGPLASLIGGECGRCAPRRRMAADVERLESAPGVAADLLALNDTCSQCHGTGRTVGVLPALVRDGVVERVEVTDREPLSGSGASFCWQNKDHPHQNYHDDLECYMLPGFVIDMMPTGWSDNICLRLFNTREAAVSALSTALIAWAESEGEK